MQEWFSAGKSRGNAPAGRDESSVAVLEPLEAKMGKGVDKLGAEIIEETRPLSVSPEKRTASPFESMASLLPL